MDPRTGKLHYPPPEGPLTGTPTVNPRRQLAPLCAPPALIPLPSPLPRSLQRKETFGSTHQLSVHILPATFPRAPSTYGAIEIPPPEYFASKSGSKNVKKERVKWLNEAVVGWNLERDEADKTFPHPTSGVRIAEKGLWTTVSRIRRNESCASSGKRGITLVVAHPIGFHKEIWEPMFKSLIELTERQTSSVRIEEIWSVDAVTHGDAALLNGAYLPKLRLSLPRGSGSFIVADFSFGEADRSDYGRDLANLIIHFLPESGPSFGSDLPLELSRVPVAVSDDRVKNGFFDRVVVGMGHSLGGDATAVCALNYPKLFAGSAIVLVDTTIFPSSGKDAKRRHDIAVATLGRRSSWESRQEARAGLLKSPMFQAFDPAILDVYIEHGMYVDPQSGEVRLKSTPFMEASEYSEQRTMSEVWELLPTLDETIEIRWILGGSDSASDLVGGPHITRRTVWRRQTNSSNVKIAGAGHLVVEEKPTAVAEDVASFLIYKYRPQANEVHVKL